MNKHKIFKDEIISVLKSAPLRTILQTLTNN